MTERGAKASVTSQVARFGATQNFHKDLPSTHEVNLTQKSYNFLNN